MEAVVRGLRSFIEREIYAPLQASDRTDYRWAFRGLPRRALLELWQGLTTSAALNVDGARVPVLLVDDVRRETMGVSSVCSWSDVISCRNGGNRFLVLHHYDERVPESISSVVTNLGQGPIAAVLQGRLDQWRNQNPLVRELLALLPATLDEDLENLLAIALDQMRSRDGLDGEQVNVEQWALIDAFVGCASGGDCSTEALTALLGFPPTRSGTPDATLQSAAMRSLGEHLQSRGVGPGLDAIDEPDGPFSSALAGLKLHLRTSCDGPQFQASPSFFYRPHLVGGVPPDWWRSLTAEDLLELLDADPPQVDELSILVEPAITLLRPVPGAQYYLVRQEPRFVLQPAPTADARSTAELAGRIVARRKAPRPTPLGRTATGWNDIGVPDHLRPIDYLFDATGFKSASRKVICLAAYRPGFVIRSGSARAAKSPRQASARSGVTWICDVSFPVAGRHQLDIYVDPSRIEPTRAVLGGSQSSWTPQSPDDEWVPQPVMRVGTHHFSIQLDLQSDSSCVVFLGALTGSEQSVLVTLGVGTDAPNSVDSLYRALVEENLEPRRGPRQVFVQPTLLQTWEASHLADAPAEGGQAFGLPVAFSDDLDVALGGISTVHSVVSRRHFVSDPRPTYTPPDVPLAVGLGMRALRARLTAMLQDRQLSFLQELPMAELVRDPESSLALTGLVSAYREWLADEPRHAMWFCTFAYFEADSSATVLEREPTALLLPPLHPLRLVWQALAQASLNEAIGAGTPCGLASVFNPCAIPDGLALPCATGTGRWDDVPMLAVNTSSEYWSVLWNARRLDRLRSARTSHVFSRLLRLELEGLAGGLSEGQTRRALDDVDELGCARTTVRVSVHSQEGGSSDCTRGIERWCRETLGDSDPWKDASPRRLEVFDHRTVDFPEPEELANLARGTLGAVDWYQVGGQKTAGGITADLAILSHLGALQPEVVPSPARTATSLAGLVRFRVRRNHPTEHGHIVTESRIAAVSADEQGGGLAGEATSLLRVMEESLGQRAFQFSPNWDALHLAVRGARYCAVSSSDTDPSGFSRPDSETYLWDYDLPSRARHGLQDSGYYLVARGNDEALAALREAFKSLASNRELSDVEALKLLSAISNRGVPSLKHLSAGGSAASGEIAVLAALQVLQPTFDAASGADAEVFPAVDGSRINLLVPVDPFRHQLETLADSLGVASTLRPDLLAISIAFPSDASGRIGIRLTPIEVKFRSARMAPAGQDDALGQATGMCRVLHALVARMAGHPPVDLQGEAVPSLWRLAAQGALAAWLDFGLRVYARSCNVLRPDEWAKHHEDVLCAMVTGSAAIEVDAVGRLLLFQNSLESTCFDRDGDGLAEVLEVSHADAADLLASPERRGALAQRASLLLPSGWGLLASTPIAAAPQADTAVGPQATATGPLAHAAGDRRVAPALAAEGPSGGTQGNAGPTSVASATPSVGICFPVGTTTRHLRSSEVLLRPSNTRLSHLNVGIVGDMGTGKTQLTKYLITRLTLSSSSNGLHQPRFLVFDYKNDYSQADFVAAVGANVVRPERIPLNLFSLPPSPDRPHDQRDWVRRANFIYDALSRIYSGVGAVQKDRLKRAVVSAYQRVAAANRQAPLLAEVLADYAALGRPDSISSILSDLVDMDVFTSDPDAVVPFSDFLAGVVVLQLSALGADQNLKNTIVVFFLNLFYDFMITLRKRPFVGTDPQLRHVEAFLLVDEADNIMQRDFQVLRQILQEGREFGVGVLLASQYLSHFRTSGYDYREPLLTWFIHRVPNITSRDLEGLGLSALQDDVLTVIKRLENHEFFCKTLAEDGTFAMGRTFWALRNEIWAQQHPDDWERYAIARRTDAATADAGLRAAMQASPPNFHLWVENAAPPVGEQ